MLKKLSLLFLIVLVSAGCIKQATDDSVNVPEHIQQAPPQNMDSGTSSAPPPSQANPPAPAESQTNTTITYKGVAGKNALELLRSNHQVATKMFSGVGEFVESIDGLKPDSKHFWSFYVNGKSSNVGADSYVTKSGDTIEWKLEEIK